MEISIIHSLPSRLRIRVEEQFSTRVKERLEAFALLTEGVHTAKFNPRTRSLVASFDSELAGRELIEHLKGATLETIKNIQTIIPSDEELAEKRSLMMATVRLMLRPITPIWLKPYMSMYGASPVLREGLRSLRSFKMDTELLDAAAVGTALALKDYGTASTTSYLLKLGGYLEFKTKEKSRRSFRDMLEVKDHLVWVRTNDIEREVLLSDVKVGDHVVVRAGHMIPVDGFVYEGEAMVNQASLTGEPLAINKRPRLKVFARTVVEEGELVVEAEQVGSDTKISHIIKMIEESAESRSALQSKAENMADKLVPYMFLTSGLTYFFTKSAVKAASVLVVDYSCALKLTTPLAISSAMLESSKQGLLIKGGKYIEKLADCNAFIFDKTGTLTKASPSVERILTFNGHSENEVLRIAACLEEHFNHPVARAVVDHANAKELIHEENHTKVEYIVAHGIISTMDDKRLALGSSHFLREHENVCFEDFEDEIHAVQEHGLSLIYLSVAGVLVGAIAIDDPIKDDAISFINSLKESGHEKIVMITGDCKKTATKVAGKLDIGEFYAEVMPEDKHNLILDLKDKGYNVAMIGDGMNDAPALTSADIGISMNHGADLAKESSNVVLMGDGLEGIIHGQRISKKAIQRIKNNYSVIVGVNSWVLMMGMLGGVTPAIASLIHNSTTVYMASRSVRPYQ